VLPSHTLDLALLEIGQVLPHGCREGVVRTRPPAAGEERFVFVGMSEEWELGDPEEVRRGGKSDESCGEWGVNPRLASPHSV
jgi:hypothetical protein